MAIGRWASGANLSLFVEAVAQFLDRGNDPLDLFILQIRIDGQADRLPVALQCNWVIPFLVSLSPAVIRHDMQGNDVYRNAETISIQLELGQDQADLEQMPGVGRIVHR